MLYLVSYDIVKDKQRTKLAKKLLDFGIRVQYSVFECDLDNKRLKEMLAQIKHFVDKKTDSLRIYKICDSCSKQIKSLGIKTGWLEEEDVTI